MSASPKTPGVSPSSGKAIVLFSDGTGNSSAKLFKTNVWRMYEAVDLGPAASDRRPQIAYYDDGVGTSSFKPLAVLGGVFGYGLKRNVLDIYKYACRNYKEGDDLYAFGFSRGAFTIRLVAALIAEQGLVTSTDEGQLDRLARCSYRDFRKCWLPRRLQWPTKLARAIRDRFTGQRKYTNAVNHKPDIRFVGVWDTVSAYGGPIVEMTRAIDNWIFPLSMPDYQLSTKVQCARHALALDDERDAFHPLLWDEVHENALVAGKVPGEKQVGADRLQQVWFTGMHSDVGGGYPDESLSYVSLLWMMEEAEKERNGQPGLRTLEIIKARFRALASSAGPLHDSRKGVASYYRYQPRRIAGWLQPVDPRTYGLRDPQIRDDHNRQKGLLTSVKVHESVIARIARGTDRYAPITLPEKFIIFPPQAQGENMPQVDSVETQKVRAAGAYEAAGIASVAAAGVVERVQAAVANPEPLVSDALRARLGKDAVCAAREEAFEAVWDAVWHRRVMYFLTIGFTLLLAAMPLWVDLEFVPKVVLTDGRTWIDAPMRAAGGLLPAFLSPWINTFADNPSYLLLLAGLIYWCVRRNASSEQKLRDQARHIWQASADVNGGPPVPAQESRLSKLRNSVRYQRGVQGLKWAVLPRVILFLMMVVALWLGAAGITQLALPRLESGSALCQSATGSLPSLVSYDGIFEPSSLCHPVGMTVAKNRRYRVELGVEQAWFDGSYATNPDGLRARDLGFAGIVGGPFRRVIEANFLQPVIEIRQGARPWPLDKVHIDPLEMTEQQPGLFAGQFKAPQDGELFVFPNDAVMLPNLSYFYAQRPGLNTGSARLRIARLEEAPAASMPHPERFAGGGR
jgi:uncharacterized protein (DUF2235 family)